MKDFDTTVLLFVVSRMNVIIPSGAAPNGSPFGGYLFGRSSSPQKFGFSRTLWGANMSIHKNCEKRSAIIVLPCKF